MATSLRSIFAGVWSSPSRAACRVERQRRTFEWRVDRDPLGGASARDGGSDRRSQAIEAQGERILALIAAELDSTLEELKAALAVDGHAFSISALSRFSQPASHAQKRPRTPPSRNGRTS